MLVREMMSDHAEWITPDLTVKEAAQKMRDMDIGCLPVGENDRLVGMLTDRDITCRTVAEGMDPATTQVRQCMSPEIKYCFDDQDAEDAAHIMEQAQIRRLPVLNRDKRLIGMISMGDVALHCSHEISGEVAEAIARPAH